MIYQEIEEPPSRAAAWLNYAALLLTMVVAAGILTAALYFQYSAGELPCPLCLLQRAGAVWRMLRRDAGFRHGFFHAHSGISMIFSVFLLIVAARQTLLDIYPRPGHAYIGEAVLGLHMPVSVGADRNCPAGRPGDPACAVRRQPPGAPNPRPVFPYYSRAGEPGRPLRHRARGRQSRVGRPAMRPGSMPYLWLPASDDGAPDTVNTIRWDGVTKPQAAEPNPVALLWPICPRRATGA